MTDFTEQIRLYEPHRRQPRIAAIGGGHGLSAMLRGLKTYTKDITAIVTVADDGGGSGMLREDLGMLPPGDIRNCIMALANTEPTMQQLLNYRFTDGSLAGQSFGNLFLAAMNGISGSFDEAVHRMGDVLAITGRVLPVTNQDVRLEAEFHDGSRILGESKIFYAKKINNSRIRKVRLVPERPAALPESVRAIRDADIVVIGPGSLYTRIIPIFLVCGIAEAYGVDFIDFVSMDQVTDYATDCFDANEHLNPSGARKVSDYLGRYIAEHYEIADRRGEAAYAAWADDTTAYRTKKLADFQNQGGLESALMLLHDDDFACEITVSAGCALFDSEKLTTLMQNVAREHIFEEDMFAKWSNSLFPLEKLDEAAESGRSYRVRIDRAAGKAEEEVGGDVPEGVSVALLDRESGEILCEKRF